MSPTQGQTAGLAVIVVIAALVYAGNILSPLIFPAAPRFVPCRGSGKAGLAVALNVDGQAKGVYFMRPGATAADLLRAARIQITPSRHSQHLLKLRAGQKVCLATAPLALLIGNMNAAELLALDLPLDLNKASFAELVLIPGIGEKTAARIIAVREQKNGFRRLVELEEIRGIKEKKMARLKKYLALAPP